MTTPFERLQQITDDQGVEAGLGFLEQHVRRNQDYAQLFEVLKMRFRHAMGLPILYSQARDNLSEADQRKLEDGLFAACLLYTSPSPRDQRGSRMPSSA